MKKLFRKKELKPPQALVVAPDAQQPPAAPVKALGKSDVKGYVESLSARDFSGIHSDQLKARHQDTGEWLLRRDEFVDWLKKEESAFLWCHGKPGAGKTVIASIILENLLSLRSNDVGVAFAYFDYRATTPSDHLKLVNSLLVQLCDNWTCNYPDCIVQLSKISDPMFEDLCETFRKLTESFSEVRILIDALDECEAACQSEVLSLIKRATETKDGQDRKSRVKILLTSRTNPAIEECYTNLFLVPRHKIEIRATNGDIEKYVRFMVEEHKKCQKQAGKHTPFEVKDLKERAIEKLVEKSEGMFLWAKLQVAQLRDKKSEHDVEIFIASLPPSVEIADTYLRMVKQINALPPANKSLAKRALLWMTYAARPLTTYELEAATQIGEPKSEGFSAGSNLNLILNSCSNFLVREESTNHISLVHFSAQEFFKDGTKRKKGKLTDDYKGLEEFFPSRSAAQLEMAKQCLNYLLSVFREDHGGAIRSLGWFLIIHQLAWYCCQFFDEHLRQATEIDKDTIELVNELLETGDAALPSFMMIRTLESTWDFSEFEKEVKFWPGMVSKETVIRATLLSILPAFRIEDKQQNRADAYKADNWMLHHSAFSGDVNLVEVILDNAPAEYICQRDSRGATALYYAARNGHLKICRRLLERGLSSDAGSLFSNPLQIASYNNKLPVVQLLLENGADLKLVGGFYNTALQAAAWGGHYGIVDHILKQPKDKFDVNSSAPARWYCALQAAAYNGHDAIVIRLLEAGAIVDLPEPNNQPTQFGLPLQAAMQSGHVSTGEILLKAGAKIDAVSGTDGTALQAAAMRGYPDAVEFLLDHHATVDKQAGESGTALQAALCRGFEGVVDILLKHNADIHLKCGKYGHSLQAAATGGNENLVRIVLKHGADVNEKGGYFASALIAAAKEGNLSIVSMLVEHGADLDAFDRNYGTPLDAAAYPGNIQVVRYLLAKGAKIGGSLIEVASTGIEDIAKELLDRGAKVNEAGRSPYKTALQAAAWGGKPGMVKLLLDNGADVHKKGGVYGNVLQAAVYTGDEEVIRLIVEHGANVNAITRKQYGTALQCACRRVNEGVVEYLLEKGADVNVKVCGKYGTALQAAVSKNYEPIVKRLLENGANVDTQGGKFGTALQAAAYKGNEGLVKLLLDHKAEVNAECGKYGTALQAAAYRGNENLVRLLLSNEAKVNIVCGEYGTALQAAAFSGNEDLVQLLLDHKADVNTVSGKHGTALQAAAAKGYEGITQVLLKNNAKILKGGEHGSPWGAAEAGGYDNILQLLNPNTDIGLQLAAFRGDLPKIKKLLSEGKDANAVGSIHGNALQAAVIGHQPEAVTLLLEKKADIFQEGGKYGNVLFAVGFTMQEDMLGLLLQHGLLKDGRKVIESESVYGRALQAVEMGGFNELVNFLMMNSAEILPYVECFKDKSAEL